MFPVELLSWRILSKPQQGIELNRLFVTNFLDEDMLNRIAGNTADRLGDFLQFSSATAGLIGIWLIIKTIKVIADTIIHGYALHSL